MHFTLYTSRALIKADPAQHNNILEVSQRNNRLKGLTGFLHREGAFFLQYLEGPKTAVFDSLSRIATDSRHTDFEVLEAAPATKALMPDWQMGFVDAGTASLCPLLRVRNGRLCLASVDHRDLIAALTANASGLRSRHVDVGHRSLATDTALAPPDCDSDPGGRRPSPSGAPFVSRAQTTPSLAG